MTRPARRDHSAAIADAAARLFDAADRAQAARTVLYAEVRDAVAAGMSESQAARLARIDRMTVRRILGKGK